jgi:signal transduction histidine kinase
MHDILSNSVSLNLAIVGGGQSCKFFLELFRYETFAHIQVKVIAVCDIDTDAVGFILAQELGIFTTTDFRALFDLEYLDGIIELTNNKEVLIELILQRPKHVWILEHNVGQLMRRLFTVDQQLQSTEQKVLFEKAITEFLIQQAKQRIVVLNTDFTIAEANDAYLRSVGKKREDVIGALCYKVIHEFNAPCDSIHNGMDCPMVETIRSGASAQVIHPDPTAGDPTAYCDIVTYPVKDASGQTVRVIEIWRDITTEISSHWQKREMELKSNLNKLVQEDRLISLGKLVASCVHEINNPIQGLLTFSQLMSDMLTQKSLTDDEIGKLRKFSALMSNELERCGCIVSGLLSFSRESQMELKDIDLNEVLTSVIELTRHKMELSDIYLKINLTPKALYIHGDRNRLQQCFLNLIFNAIEAIQSGGNIEVVSAMSGDSRYAKVEIQDSGPGIAAEHLDHIYDPFFTTKEIGEGTGLGLSIVYGVVKNHKGNLKVHSQEGKGTTFVLQLPLERPQTECEPKRDSLSNH